jgi:acyl-CoA thioester hydrolase
MTAPTGHADGKDCLFPVRVYYEDTDLSGFVYHGQYVAFFERGRTEALRAAGITHSELLRYDPPAVMVVRRMEIDWIRPAVIDDLLMVRSTIESIRGARMTMRQQIEREGEVIAKASLEAALITRSGGPRRFPSQILELLQPWIDQPTP